MYYVSGRGELKSEKVTYHFGELEVLRLGESGRGRQEIILPCPPNTTVHSGINFLSIGFSRSGKPKIVTQDSDVYLLINTYGGYTRRGDGKVFIYGNGVSNVCNFRPVLEYKNRILAQGNGADGDAGRIGTWDTFLIKPQEGDIYKVQFSGGRDGDVFIIYTEGKITRIEWAEVDLAFDEGFIDQETYNKIHTSKGGKGEMRSKEDLEIL